MKDKHYLSIDLGIKNPVTMVDSKSGLCLILGREYISRDYYFEKKINELNRIYRAEGIEDFATKRMVRLVKKRKNTLSDILHKLTRFITNYAVKNDITSVIVGNIKESPETVFPFERFYIELKKKLKREGVKICKHSEAFTSQCSPRSKRVDRKNAEKDKRVSRGLFIDDDEKYNADGVGALNILRSFLQEFGLITEIPLNGIKSPKVLTVSD